MVVNGLKRQLICELYNFLVQLMYMTSYCSQQSLVGVKRFLLIAHELHELGHLLHLLVTFALEGCVLLLIERFLHL